MWEVLLFELRVGAEDDGEEGEDDGEPSKELLENDWFLWRGDR